MLHHKGKERRPVYGNRLCLANAMTTIFCLTINLWVEIHIMNHYSISSSQVQTLASSSCGQQACKYRSVIIECVDYCLSFCDLSTVIRRKKVILRKQHKSQCNDRFQYNQTAMCSSGKEEVHIFIPLVKEELFSNTKPPGSIPLVIFHILENS